MFHNISLFIESHSDIKIKNIKWRFLALWTGKSSFFEDGRYEIESDSENFKNSKADDLVNWVKYIIKKNLSIRKTTTEYLNY